PDSIRIGRAADLELGGHDLICLAVPARALPGVLAAHGERIPRRAGLLVVSKGLVPPLGTLPSAFASERCRARGVAALGGPAHAADALEHGASVVVASVDPAFSRQLADALRTAGLDVSISADVTGVELAGCATNAAVLAAAAAASAGPNVAGAWRGQRSRDYRRWSRVGSSPSGGRPPSPSQRSVSGRALFGPREQGYAPMLWTSRHRKAKLSSTLASPSYIARICAMCTPT